MDASVPSRSFVWQTPRKVKKKKKALWVHHVVNRQVSCECKNNFWQAASAHHYCSGSPHNTWSLLCNASGSYGTAGRRFGRRCRTRHLRSLHHPRRRPTVTIRWKAKAFWNQFWFQSPRSETKPASLRTDSTFTHGRLAYLQGVCGRFVARATGRRGPRTRTDGVRALGARSTG